MSTATSPANRLFSHRRREWLSLLRAVRLFFAFSSSLLSPLSSLLSPLSSLLSEPI